MRLGIIGAMDSEVANLIARMEQVTYCEKAGRRFAVGTLAGKEVVVVQSGIGKVAAAITAQMLIDTFGVDGLLNTGMAGGLDARLAVKDLVIATAALQHDFDITAFGHARGFMYGEDDQKPTLFVADQALCEKARQAAETVLPAGSKAAAIAQTAVANGVPFVILRTISDLAEHQANVSFDELEQYVGKLAGDITVALLASL